MTSQTWFSFRAAADSLTIDITDVIGYFGVSAHDFLDRVKSAGSFSSVELNINSPGGDVIDGFVIYDGLRALGVPITANVIGTAASMASVVLLAADPDKRNIAENAQVMIHRVTSGAGGNADELEAAAKITKQFEDRIVAVYVERTGNEEEQIREWMKTSQGTWFMGQDAIDAGFASGMIKKKKPAAFKNEWAARFTMLPAALFDSAGKDMDNQTPPPAPEIEPIPAAEPETQVIEPISPTPETPVEHETAPEVEAKGILERITAAFTGSEKLKAELAKASAALIDRDGEIAALKAEVQALKPQAAQLTEITAKLAEAEAKAKSVGLAAAEIAAAHGLRSEQLAELPAPSENMAEQKQMTREDFDKLNHAARNAFMASGGKLI